MSKCCNICNRYLEEERPAAVCPDCHRAYRRGWQDGYTSDARNTLLYARAGDWEVHEDGDNAPARLTPLDLQRMVDRIATREAGEEED